MISIRLRFSLLSDSHTQDFPICAADENMHVCIHQQHAWTRAVRVGGGKLQPPAPARHASPPMTSHDEALLLLVHCYPTRTQPFCVWTHPASLVCPLASCCPSEYPLYSPFHVPLTPHLSHLPPPPPRRIVAINVLMEYIIAVGELTGCIGRGALGVGKVRVCSCRCAGCHVSVHMAADGEVGLFIWLCVGLRDAAQQVLQDITQPCEGVLPQGQ